MKGKYLLFQLVIVLNTFAAAATCDVALDSSSSVAQVVKLATDGLSATQSLEADDTSKIFKGRNVFFMCREMIQAKYKPSITSWQAFVQKVESTAKKVGVNIGDTEEFISDNIHNFVCKNNKRIKMREKSSIFKFALDQGSFDFVREAMLLKDKNGNYYCNPKIDFKKTEIVNGESETLLSFFDSMIKKPATSAVHNIPSLKALRVDIAICSE